MGKLLIEVLSLPLLNGNGHLFYEKDMLQTPFQVRKVTPQITIVDLNDFGAVTERTTKPTITVNHGPASPIDMSDI